MGRFSELGHCVVCEGLLVVGLSRGQRINDFSCMPEACRLLQAMNTAVWIDRVDEVVRSMDWTL